MTVIVVKFLVIYHKILKKLLLLLKPSFAFRKVYLNELNAVLGGNLLSAVDVGGAIDLQPHWYKLVGNSQLHIFEPHKESLKALEEKYSRDPFKDLFHIYPTALSGKGGRRTLSCTNSPTGSTIADLDENSPFVDKTDSYFFPLRKVELETDTLESSLKKNSIGVVDIIKLDVQGVELEVLKGLGPKHLARLLCFEMEVNLHKIYKNATELQDVLQFVKENSFQLFDVRVARSYIQRNGMQKMVSDFFKLETWTGSISAKSWEFDLVCFRDPAQILAAKDVQKVRNLIACYCVYNFFLEAVALLDEATSMGLFSTSQNETLRMSILKMQKSMEIEIKGFELIAKGQKDLVWGQYMWVKYPTT